MMRTLMTTCVLRGLVALAVVLVSAGTVFADGGRRGFYAGVELGLALPGGLDSQVSAVNHPTVCDTVLGTGDAQDMRERAAENCSDNTVRPLLSNTFDLDLGFMAGFSAGYVLDLVRVEFEYMNRSHGGDRRNIRSASGNAALASKDAEWAVPPTEYVLDFNAHQFFVNAYYDMRNHSRWTPYLGGGLGWAHTSLLYGNRFVRKSLEDGYRTDENGNRIDNRPAAAAGTTSYVDTSLTEAVFGYQILAGLDYALTEHVDVGVKGRWAQFEDVNGNATWDRIRSHAPVQADGVTPFTSSHAFGNLHYWAMTFGLKYYF